MGSHYAPPPPTHLLHLPLIQRRTSSVPLESVIAIPVVSPLEPVSLALERFDDAVVPFPYPHHSSHSPPTMSNQSISTPDSTAPPSETLQWPAFYFTLSTFKRAMVKGTVATGNHSIPSPSSASFNGNGRTTWAMLTLMSIAVQSIVALVLESVVIAFHVIKVEAYSDWTTQNGVNSQIVLTHTLILVQVLFQVYIFYNAILLQSFIEACSGIFFSFILLAATIVQSGQHAVLVEFESEYSNSTQQAVKDAEKNRQLKHIHSVTQAVDYTLIAFLFGSLILNLYLTMRLRGEFKWNLYKRMGADKNLRLLHRWFQLYVALLKIGFFSFLLFLVVLITMVTSKSTNLRLVIGVVFLFLNIVVPITTYRGLHREHKWTIYLNMAFAASSVGWLIYKFSLMFPVPDPVSKQFQLMEDEYAVSRYILSFWGALSMFIFLSQFFVGIFCLRNFGKGLRETWQTGNKTSHLPKRGSDPRSNSESTLQSFTTEA